MGQPRKRARTRRAVWRLFTLQQNQHLVSKFAHFSNLLRWMRTGAPSIAMVLTVNLTMAAPNTLNTPTHAQSSLLQKQVQIFFADWHLMSGTSEKSWPNPVHRRIPLGSPGGQQIGTQAAPVSDGGGAQAHNSTIAIQPVKDAGDREIRHLIAWVAWIGLCLFGGFIAGTLSAPRRKSTEGDTQNRQS